MSNLKQINEYIKYNCTATPLVQSDGGRVFTELSEENIEDIRVLLNGCPSAKAMRTYFFDKEGYMVADAIAKNYWAKHHPKDTYECSE